MKKMYESPEFDLHRFRFEDILAINISEGEDDKTSGSEGTGENPFEEYNLFLNNLNRQRPVCCLFMFKVIL